MFFFLACHVAHRSNFPDVDLLEYFVYPVREQVKELSLAHARVVAAPGHVHLVVVPLDAVYPVGLCCIRVENDDYFVS